MQAAREHIARPHIMVRGHDEMRQQRLAGAFASTRRPSSRTMPSGPDAANSSSCADRDGAARRSVKLTISPLPDRRSHCAAHRRNCRGFGNAEW